MGEEDSPKQPGNDEAETTDGSIGNNQGNNDDFSLKEAAQRAARYVLPASLVAAALISASKHNTASRPDTKPIPIAQFDSQNKIEHIKFVAEDAVGRTQEIIWLLHEKYITPEYWDGVVVLKGGTKLSLTPNNQTLGLPASAESKRTEAEFHQVPEDETWVAKDPKIFGTINGPDYLYFEVDGKVYWLEINSPEATEGAEWYLANGQLGQANQIQFSGGRQIDPSTNPKEGQSFKRIDREDWHRYLETIGVDKNQSPTSQPGGY